MALEHFEDGEVLYASDLNDIVDQFPGFISNPQQVFAPASGWVVQGFAARRAGGIATISVRLTGGSVSGGGSTAIGTLQPGWRPGSGFVIGAAYYAGGGFLSGLVIVGTGGVISAAKENTADRSEIRFSLTIPLAN